jgi:hypothetical protein
LLNLQYGPAFPVAEGTLRRVLLLPNGRLLELDQKLPAPKARSRERLMFVYDDKA